MDYILVLNSGSSSLKSKLYDFKLNHICSLTVERIGQQLGSATLEYNQQKEVNNQPFADHFQAINYILEMLVTNKIVTSINDIKIVGHRVVHGGEYFNSAIEANQDVVDKIDELIDLSPLHNQANNQGVKVIKEVLPEALNVCVFDTAFHQTMSEVEYLYPLNYSYYQDYKLRRYGMHGTSHKYCMEMISKHIAPNLKIINCHLGAGSSLCAINNQQSVATTMGLTPLGGLMMATRCGDIDPSIVSFLASKLDKSADEVVNILNKESGLLGVSQASLDMRDLNELADNGNKQAKLAIEMYVNRVVNFISSYITKLQGIDVLSFTAGIGEKDSGVRNAIVKQLNYLGIKLDESIIPSGDYCEIQAPDSQCKIVVIKADEELAIAKEALAVYENKNI